MQHLKEYVSPKSISTSIEIKLRTTQNWLHKLGFGYKDVKKNIFIDRYKWTNMVQDCQNFLNVMKKLESYLVEFNKDKG